MPYIENFADALPDAARVAEEKSRLEAAVSYTHLTLPPIYSV